MNRTQKQALLNYLEFHLLSMVEHVQPDVTGLTEAKLYNYAYEILIDMDQTIDDFTLMSPPPIRNQKT